MTYNATVDTIAVPDHPPGKNNATKVTVDCDLQSFASVRQAIEELKVGGCRVSHAIGPAVQ